MNLRSIRRSSEIVPDVDEVREARVKQARRYWHELPFERLVPRGRGLLVDAESDEVFTVYRGTTFMRGTAHLIPDRADLWFYLDGDGQPVALEREHEKWSAIYARQARREAARR